MWAETGRSVVTGWVPCPSGLSGPGCGETGQGGMEGRLQRPGISPSGSLSCRGSAVEGSERTQTVAPAGPARRTLLLCTVLGDKWYRTVGVPYSHEYSTESHRYPQGKGGTARSTRARYTYCASLRSRTGTHRGRVVPPGVPYSHEYSTEPHRYPHPGQWKKSVQAPPNGDLKGSCSSNTRDLIRTPHTSELFLPAEDPAPSAASEHSAELLKYWKQQQTTVIDITTMTSKHISTACVSL